jgi:hypothetical protein
MKYYVTFQQLPAGALRPIDHPSASDFETDGLGMIPNVGDLVHLVTMGKPDAPTYEGRVRSRLFRYFNDQSCGINIVVEDFDNDQEWGKAIKE